MVSQYMIHQTLQEMSKRFDELMGQQELVLSKVTQMSSGVGILVGDSGQVRSSSATVRGCKVGCFCELILL